MNDSYLYDPLLVVENDELKNNIDCLVKSLANCHRGENTYNKSGNVKGSLSSMRVLSTFSIRTKVLLLIKKDHIYEGMWLELC
jgi:hypothetical protein